MCGEKFRLQTLLTSLFLCSLVEFLRLPWQFKAQHLTRILNKKSESTTSSNSAKDEASEHVTNTQTAGICQSGPYVYDKSVHREGIGSTFQFRKYSLIFADALNGRWIGQLQHAHNVDEGNHALKYFGLGDQNCQEEDLFHNSTSFLNYIYTNWTHALAPERPIKLPDIKELCLLIQRNKTVFHLDDKLRRTVFVFGGDALRENYNYCLFNHYFRKRYYMKQKERRISLRSEHENWISVHFRWGDVATESVQSPDPRASTGLHNYIQATDLIRNILSESSHNRQTYIHFFSEGNTSDFLSFSEKFPNARVHINGNWTNAVDIMSQSNVLIGGKSSFFVLGSLLCRKCTVMSFAPRPKFDVSAVESLLSSHVKHIVPP